MGYITIFDEVFCFQSYFLKVFVQAMKMLVIS